MTRPVRSFKGVENEFLRTRKIRGVGFDELFNKYHDEMSEAYYGDRRPDGGYFPGTGWKHGVSKPWTYLGRTFDMQPTLRESKALFDRLHGLLWRRYAVSMHKLNMSLPLAQRRPREEYDAGRRNEAGEVIEWKSERNQAALDSQANDPDDPIDFGDPT